MITGWLIQIVLSTPLILFILMVICGVAWLLLTWALNLDHKYAGVNKEPWASWTMPKGLEAFLSTVVFDPDATEDDSKRVVILFFMPLLGWGLRVLIEHNPWLVPYIWGLASFIAVLCLIRWLSTKVWDTTEELVTHEKRITKVENPAGRVDEKKFSLADFTSAVEHLGDQYDVTVRISVEDFDPYGSDDLELILTPKD